MEFSPRDQSAIVIRSIPINYVASPSQRTISTSVISVTCAVGGSVQPTQATTIPFLPASPTGRRPYLHQISTRAEH